MGRLPRIEAMSKKPIEGVTVFRHWSEYVDTPERFISGIEFRPEENQDWNYKGCPPYMVAFVGHDFDTAEFYLIPPAMAYYAATHQGWTRDGRENMRMDGRETLQAELRGLLGVKNSEDE